MKTMYINGTRIDYRVTKYANKTVVDAWVVNGIRMINSEYFGEYHTVKDLEETVRLCKERGLI